MKDMAFEDIRHLGEPVDDGLRAFVDETMPKHLWRMPKAGGPKQALRCEACGALMEMDDLLGQQYDHGKKITCPGCGVQALGVDSWRGRMWLQQRMYTEWWRKSAVDPNALVCVGVLAVRRYETDPANTLFFPEGFIVYEYGKPGRRYQFTDSKGEQVKRMQRAKDMSYMAPGCWVAQLPIRNFTEACAGTPFGRLDLTLLDGKYERAGYVNFLSARPCCEYLMRFGFGRLIRQAWDPYTMDRGIVNWRGKTAQKVLKLGKVRIREITRAKIDLDMDGLSAIQRFEAMGLNWPVERILPFRNHLIELNARATDYKLELTEVIRYIDRQMRKDKAVKAGDILDYWRQCVALRMSLHDMENVYPRDLARMHQALTDRIHAIEDEKRALEAAKRKKQLETVVEPKVAKVAKKLAAAYTYSACGLTLRPAVSAAEVVDEGTALHHCVGSYVNSYADGRTILCVLRRAEAPDQPFHTVEFSLAGTMVQCRGFNNQTRGEDKPLIEAFWAAFELWRTEKVRASA